MILEMFQDFVFQESSSIYMRVMPVLTFLILFYLAMSELTGKHLQYSKFMSAASNQTKQASLSSKLGMFLFYAPAFLAGISSFVLFPNVETRFLILKSAVTIHFLKRVLEVLFVHKFSGSTGLNTTIIISLCYFTVAANMIYSQSLIQGFPDPTIDLKYIGVLLFVVGIIGNLYHHHLLSKLRKNSTEKVYKIPTGGLFSKVICPHYLFEILTFIGMAFISQTLFSFSCALGSALYLGGRSYTTKKWYLSKFDNFPKNVRALIPYVF